MLTLHDSLPLFTALYNLCALCSEQCRWMWKGSICFFIQNYLEPICIHSIGYNETTSYLNRGTSFQITCSKDSGDIADFPPSHIAINVFLNSSTNKLKYNKTSTSEYRWLNKKYILSTRLRFKVVKNCT